MRINRPIQPAAPAAPLLCEHCGARLASGAHSALHVHIGDNPPDGRPSINVIGPGFLFCSPQCRAAWFEVPGAAPLIAGADLLATPHPLSVTVFHIDPWTRDLHCRIETDDGQDFATQNGEPVAHHRLDSHTHLERWWRCECEVETLELPLVGAPPATEKEPGHE